MSTLRFPSFAVSFVVVSAWLSGADVWVSSNGTDAGRGSPEAPLRTIARAIEIMRPGDRCVLRGGVYREALVIEKPRISIVAADGEHVLLTGLLEVAGPWESYRVAGTGETISRVPAASRIYQVFRDGREAELARWPDNSGSRFSLKDWAETTMDGPNGTVTIPGLKPPSGSHWQGAVYLGLHHEKVPLHTFYSIGGIVSAGEGDLLRLDEPSYGFNGRNGRGTGFGYLINSIHAISREDEWCWKDGYLYMKLPAGDAGTVEAQVHPVIIEAKADGLTVEGIHFKAGTVNLRGNDGSLRRCTFRYASAFHHFRDEGGTLNWGNPEAAAGGVFVSGDRAKIIDCYFARSWWSGITIYGNRTLMENCVVEDCNWIGKRGGGIQCVGDDNIIRRCTIRRTGGASIEGGNGNWLKRYAKRNVWELNWCEEPGNLLVDQGFFYVNQQRGDNPPAYSVWRYNFLLNYKGPDRGKWFESGKIGLYIDNSSSGYTVHHNVIVGAPQAIRYNDNQDGEQAGKEIVICNNTVYRADLAFALGVWRDGRVFEKGRPPRMDAEITFINNLALDCGGFGFQRGNAPVGINNYSFVEAKANVVDAEKNNFSLKETSGMINLGHRLAGITDGYVGAWPDVGALEFGKEPWKAGATLTIPSFPDESRRP
jgi:hypothetical protein